MKHYCNPMNLEYRFQFLKRPEYGGDNDLYNVNREAADPSLVLFKNMYYLFPSMTAGFFTSEDLYAWEYYELSKDMPVYDYAPDVRVIGEYLYFCASAKEKTCCFYRSKDPTRELFEKLEGQLSFWDPNLFFDDDGKLYFYWGCSDKEPIYGTELDPDSMKFLNEKKALITSHEEVRGYERAGEEHKAFDGKRNPPYLEGPWMTKYGGKYYLQYAIPGTEYNVYGDGVYVGETPLGPFKPARNNPYSYKPGGFVTGAGHGSTLQDKQGQYWHTSCLRISVNDKFERRLGLWKAGFDKDGELYCDQRYGDWPVALDAKPFDQPDWMLLSYGKKVRVSSGRGAEHITDENIRTFWKAGSCLPGQWGELDLGGIRAVYAVQINFQEDGIRQKLPEGETARILPDEERWLDTRQHYTRWLLEGSVDGADWFVLEDKRQCETDLPHDFIESEEGIELRFLRLTIEEVPFYVPPCISGLRVFGKSSGEKPS